MQQVHQGINDDFYYEDEQGICPKCTYRGLTFDSIVVSGTAVTRPFYCSNCKSVGQENYTVNFHNSIIVDTVRKGVPIVTGTRPEQKKQKRVRRKRNKNGTSTLDS